MAWKAEAFQICFLLWPGSVCEIRPATVVLCVPVAELRFKKEDGQQTLLL